MHNNFKLKSVKNLKFSLIKSKPMYLRKNILFDNLNLNRTKNYFLITLHICSVYASVI